MEFNYFDLVAAVIILMLGLKGIINGFFKEFFGLVGIIGGIFVASRVGDSVGAYLNQLIFKFDNTAAANFSGFLATLAIFWLFMILIGSMFKKLSSLSGLGPIDKILGFVFGASKFFLIAAVIAHAAYNIKAVKNTLDSSMKSSILFPILVETGSYIMKLDPVEINDKINKSLDKNKDAIQKQINETLSNSTLDIVNDTKEQIKQSMPQADKNGTKE